MFQRGRVGWWYTYPDTLQTARPSLTVGIHIPPPHALRYANVTLCGTQLIFIDYFISTQRKGTTQSSVWLGYAVRDRMTWPSGPERVANSISQPHAGHTRCPSQRQRSQTHLSISTHVTATLDKQCRTDRQNNPTGEADQRVRPDRHAKRHTTDRRGEQAGAVGIQIHIIRR
ncbi:hypothetical protein BHAP_2133 [Bifidobacterium hapali]|uniref:Uncharacterized protein n=1 Tax=Bifidobacterium hapali TaxID=1630172 RepID=A0A261FSH6_9BIFI|nr:hypothetical protein BHAP_2133 [Bifidobacterium hapali]